MDPSAALRAFAAVFPAELPDKTMIATVVLVTRYQRPLPVWCGAAAAFTVHVVVAVAAGGLLTLLPETAVKLATAVLFAAGALILYRSSRSPGSPADDLAEAGSADHSDVTGSEVGGGAAGSISPLGAGPDVEVAGPTSPPSVGVEGEAVGVGASGGGARVAGAGLPSVRAAVTGSFGVIVLAEWGDLTQFATAGMAASTGEPLMVAVGALLALWAVAGLAATVGRQVASRLPIHLIQRAAAGVFAVLALSVLWSLRA